MLRAALARRSSWSPPATTTRRSSWPSTPAPTTTSSSRSASTSSRRGSARCCAAPPPTSRPSRSRSATWSSTRHPHCDARRARPRAVAARVRPAAAPRPARRRGRHQARDPRGGVAPGLRRRGAHRRRPPVVAAPQARRDGRSPGVPAQRARGRRAAGRPRTPDTPTRGLMARRIAWLVAVTTSAVVVAFIVPLCFLIANIAEDRGTTRAPRAGAERRHPGRDPRRHGHAVAHRRRPRAARAGGGRRRAGRAGAGRHGTAAPDSAAAVERARSGRRRSPWVRTTVWMPWCRSRRPAASRSWSPPCRVRAAGRRVGCVGDDRGTGLVLVALSVAVAVRLGRRTSVPVTEWPRSPTGCARATRRPARCRRAARDR